MAGGHGDMQNIPDRIRQGIADGTWRDPGPAWLRSILVGVPDLPDMRLFATESEMASVASMLDTNGLVDDPEFCMTRSPTTAEDPRLPFPSAVFVAGSRVPGDDVLVAVTPDERVVVFDWSRPVPKRWVPLLSLHAFCAALRARA